MSKTIDLKSICNGTSYADRVRIEFVRIHGLYGWSFGKQDASTLLKVSIRTLEDMMKNEEIKFSRATSKKNSKVIFYAIDVAGYLCDYTKSINTQMLK